MLFSNVLLVSVWFLYRIPMMLYFTYIIFTQRHLFLGGILMLILVGLHGIWSLEILQRALQASKIT